MFVISIRLVNNMKAMRSNRIFKLFSALLAVLMLVACAPPTESRPTAVTLTLWHYYNGVAKTEFDSLVQTFNETVGKENGILVDAFSFSGVNELADEVLRSAAQEIGAQPMPHIFASYSDNAVVLDSMGLLADMAPHFTEEELSAYRSEFLQEGYLTGSEELKVIPIAKSSEMLYVNSTDFNEFIAATGEDSAKLSTWEGIAELSEAYYNYTDAQTDEPGDGKAMFGIDSLANFIIVSAKQLGQDIYTVENNEATLHFNEETARKIWDSYYVPTVKGYYTAIGRFRSDDVKAGVLLAYVGSTASAQYFPTTVQTGIDNSHDIEAATYPYPYFEGADKVAVQQGAGMAVTKSTEDHEKAAAVFLKWFTSVDVNMDFAVETGYLPVLEESLSFDIVSETILENEETGEMSIVYKTADTAYNSMLSSYLLYAAKPFSGSYSARSVLNYSLSDKVVADLEQLAQDVAAGTDRDTAVNELISDDNFNIWYDKIITDLQAALGEAN